jgi:hypothetical protein
MPVRIPVVALTLVLGLTVGVVAVAVLSAPRAPAGAARTDHGIALEAGPDERFAVAVLHAWDVRRAGAWAAGDVAALSRLYTGGSAAGAADVGLLRRYAARGLVVRDMRMQVLRARVLVARPGRLQLEVTDRLAVATAVRVEDTAVGLRLPIDRPTTRELVLRRVDGEWLMANVSPSPASGGRGR